MPILDDIKDIFRSSKSPARLGELEAKIGAAVAEREQHVSRRPGEIVAKLTGDPAAASRVEAIDQAVAGIDARLRDLREAADELRRRIATDEAAARQREAEARPKRIAAARGEYLASVAQMTAHARGMAAELKAMSVHADALAAEIGDEPTLRFLSFVARMHRVQSGLAHFFAINPDRALEPPNSLLGMMSGEKGSKSRWSPMQHEVTGLDDLAPFFDSEADAEAARDRLASRQTKVVVLPLPGGCFTLAREEAVFGDRAAADRAAAAAARRGRPAAIVGHKGGFVLVPEGVADGAGAA
jgi:hypothetical protein